METGKKYKEWKVVVGHGLGSRPTRRERKFSKLREQYRIDLQKAREKYGEWIPFGYNLDRLK